MADISDLMSNIEEPEGDVLENDDGSADIVDTPKKTSKVPHEANLAEYLDEFEMDSVAITLLRKIERDKEARKKRDEQYEEGIKRTGLGGEAPGGASFSGASRAVHPMLAEGCVDFAASAMRELFPSNGPAKTKIDGEVTQEKLAAAQRQEKYLNWQLTEQITEYADELEQTLTQVPMGGSQYMKFWMDSALKRISTEFVPIDDMVIPYACSDFYSAQRITHVQRLTQFVFEERMESGFYRDLEEIVETSAQPDDSKAAQASNKVEGKENTMENVDGERIVYEVNTYAEFSIDGEDELPYLISIDDQSGKVVAIYRNWEEQDHARKRLEWIVEYGFIAWRGAYKIGLPHLIGGLSSAATGSLRALLDSALMQTLPGFLRLKGARFGGQSKQVEPGQGTEVEASAAVDDIRKLVMTMPYNQPSPVLFQLLGWLTDAAKGVVTTAEEKISEASNQMPVGTSLALIEQGAKVYSSIHARLHRSQRRAFRIIARLNAKYLSIAQQVAELGEVVATREDFAKPLAVVPVSDPNIFSETQRYAQMQMVMQTATAMPQIHNMYSVVKRMYETAKIPEIDELLPPQKNPTELNAAAENSAVMLGSPIIAFPEQDHMSHLEVHMRFITDPMLGGSPASAQKSMQPMMEHVKQHLSFLYSHTMYQLASRVLGTDIGQLLKKKGNANVVDRVLAAASKQVHDALAGVLAPLGPVIQQVLQQIAAMQPPQPMTPEQASMQIAKMETDRKSKKDQADSQLEDKALNIKEQGEQTGAQLKDKQIELTHEDNQAKLGQQAAQTGQGQQLEREKMASAEQQAVQKHTVDLVKHASGLDAQTQQAQQSAALDAQKHQASLDQQTQQFREGGQVDALKHLAGLEATAAENEQGRAADLTKHFSASQDAADSQARQIEADQFSQSQDHAAQARTQAFDHAAQLHSQQTEHKEKQRAEKFQAKQAEKQAKLQAKDKPKGPKK